MLGKDAEGNDLSKKEKEKYLDKFLISLSSDKNPHKKLTFFPQTIADDKKSIPYFISHSAMREWEYEWVGMLSSNKVFPAIYEKSYKEWIIDRIMKTSKFGRY
ncbi:hypothetical protein HYE62_11455 [Aggregatibacter actinomycetemcomitans]|nr:hypothetical protein [Aggregatibacter actinomycetemcomitans]MBN6084771.1 hypothetical protein [Aggregatibacter actinomycetemcomitans]